QEKEIFYAIEQPQPVLNQNEIEKWKKADTKAYNLLALYISSSEIIHASYIDKIVSEAGLVDAKTSKYPLDPGYYKLQNSEPLPDNQEYRKLIGMLLNVTVHSRPDIASSVSILSQKVSNPEIKDLVEVKRVIKYLAATKDLSLRLSDKNSDQDLLFYSDANWAEDRTDRKSNSGYIGFVYG
ncbi:putative transposon Ty5-1 protein, partial [Polypedilum vanderplanki]